ncbi:MAG TPA: DUF1194 domain-containing protein [Alphaproteobacteria bacterium]
MTRWLLMPILLAVMSAGRPAAALPVDLQLVLAVDVSRSIDAEEARLQREGYLAALAHPQVLQAIRSGAFGRIAVTYVEWAGSSYQRTVVDWSVIDGDASARPFIEKLAEAAYMSRNWTSISGAIDYAMDMFQHPAGFESTRRVIDISGDGRNNEGREADEARDEAVAAGVTINGLPIVNDRPNFGRPPEADLDIFYREHVIGGPGAFLIVAENFSSFASAILNKLIREIAGEPPAVASAEGD